MAEFSPSLAKTIIERVGEKKEAWMVFDMDETLAYWKKQKGLDIFSLRPTVIPFLQEILDAGVKIHFAIYSNTHSKTRVETIASTIGNAFVGVENFHPCFLFYNHFKGNPGEAGLRRLNRNNETRLSDYNMNKTVESIKHGYGETGVELTDDDVKTRLFFFDDILYPSIHDVIGANYIHMAQYKGEVSTNVAAKKNGGTKRKRSPSHQMSTKSPKGRKTRHNRRKL
jgi:hypothetical protein